MPITFDNPGAVFALPDLISQTVTIDGGRLLVLSGQVAWDDSGAIVGLGDHGAQTAQIVDRVDRMLAALGTDRSAIVKETVYVVGHRPELVPAILGPLRAGVATPPTSTYLGVQSLYTPDALVEIEFIVALDA